MGGMGGPVGRFEYHEPYTLQIMGSAHENLRLDGVGELKKECEQGVKVYSLSFMLPICQTILITIVSKPIRIIFVLLLHLS